MIELARKLVAWIKQCHLPRNTRFQLQKKVNSLINYFVIEQMQAVEECSFAENYEILTLLGDGGQANVYLARRGNELYAMKIYFPGESKVEAFKREVEFLGNLSNKNLINMVDAKQDAKVKMAYKPLQTRPMLVLEFAEGGSMFEHLKQEGSFKPELCRALFKTLISAIKYMDSQGVAHRDLKPDNILFDKNFRLRVSDFGLSTYSEGSDGDGILYSNVGTEGYKSPEMQMGKYEGLQADIFGAGVILFIMYNGTPPFMSTKSHDRIYKLIKERNFAKFWKKHEQNKPQGFYPPSFKNLMNAFFSYEPNLRPTFASLEEDEWMNGDEAMENEVFEELKARYSKIASQDEMKKKVEQIKLRLKNEIMDKEKKKGRSNETDFSKNYHEHLAIEVDQLPLSERNGPFVGEKPGFVIAWLQQFLDDNMKEEKCLIQCSFGECKPESLKFEVVGEREIKATLTFNFDQEEEDFKLKGRLVRSKDGKVGVEWKKEAGNDFYLNSIIFQLNRQLSLIA